MAALFPAFFPLVVAKAVLSLAFFRMAAEKVALSPAVFPLVVAKAVSSLAFFRTIAGKVALSPAVFPSAVAADVSESCHHSCLLLVDDEVYCHCYSPSFQISGYHYCFRD